MSSSRWFQRDYFLCGLCKNVQKHNRGYKAIPNPILFEPAAHARAWHAETKDSVGYVDRHMMKKCEGCNTVHGSWKWVDFQEMLRRKEAKHAQQAAASSSNNNGGDSGALPKSGELKQ